MEPARFLPRLILPTSLALATCAVAHELDDSRALIVMREENHLSVTLHVRYVDVLRRALAGRESESEFVLAHAAMSPDEFAQRVGAGRRKLESQIKVTVNGGAAATLSNWVWPDPARVHEALRQRAMAAAVGGAHVHEAPNEIHVDVTSGAPIASARAEFAEALGDVVVVWYRPRQMLLQHGHPSPTMTFP